MAIRKLSPAAAWMSSRLFAEVNLICKLLVELWSKKKPAFERLVLRLKPRGLLI